MRNLEQRLKEEVLLVDGAMGTYLHMRGLPVGYCREAVNLDKPSLVIYLHHAYLQAGADVLETNTFGANAIQLARYGLDKKVFEINYRGAQLAREVAGHRPGVLVAGSVGPLGMGIQPYGSLTEKDAEELFSEPILALAEGGVDLLFIETQHSVEEAILALKTAQRLTDLFTVVFLTANPKGLTPSGQRVDLALAELMRNGAGFVGLNCTIGPHDMLELLRTVRKKFPFPLAVMPNAGYPEMSGDKPSYPATPRYFADYVPLFLEQGVRLLGSCCGTTPEHTKAMAEVLRRVKIPDYGSSKTFTIEWPHDDAERADDSIKPSPGLDTFFGHAPVLTVELEPSLRVNIHQDIELVRSLMDAGVSVVHISENPVIQGHADPLAYAGRIRMEINVPVVLHLFSRSYDRSVLQSRILGASILGVEGLLVMGGSSVPAGEIPEFRPKGMDVMALIRMIHSFNNGQLPGGEYLEHPTRFVIGSVFNPYPSDMNEEIRRIKEKIEGGVRFFVTPPVFETDPIKRFMEGMIFSECGILVGIMPVLHLRHLKYLHFEVPGIHIPDKVLEKFARLDESNFMETALEYCFDLMMELTPYVKGFYFIAPGRQYDPVMHLARRYSHTIKQKSPSVPSY